MANKIKHLLIIPKHYLFKLLNFGQYKKNYIYIAYNFNIDI